MIKKYKKQPNEDTIASTPFGLPTPTNENLESRLAQIDAMKYFLSTAANHRTPIQRFALHNESIACIYYDGLFFITGTDIVRSLSFRFHAFGRPIINPKKFEEGIFSDLRNLKPGQDARLEEPKSELLEMLYKNNCIRTQKKQKVFYWFSVPHDRLFLDALERDLKREKMGLEPTTRAVAEPASSITLNLMQELFDQLKKSNKEQNLNLRPPLPQVNDYSFLEEPQTWSTTPPTSWSTSIKEENVQDSSSHQDLVHDSGLSSPLLDMDISDGVDQMAISRSLDLMNRKNNKLFGHLNLFDGSPSYKVRRRRTSSSSINPVIGSVATSAAASALIASGGPVRQCLRNPSMTTLINPPNSRLAMAAMKAGYDINCPIPDCQHVFKRMEHLERHVKTAHEENKTRKRHSTNSSFIPMSSFTPNSSTSSFVPTTSTSSFVPTTNNSSFVPTTSNSSFVPTTSNSSFVPITSSSSYVPTASNSSFATTSNSSFLSNNPLSFTPTTSTSSFMPTSSTSSFTPTSSTSSYTPLTKPWSLPSSKSENRSMQRKRKEDMKLFSSFRPNEEDLEFNIETSSIYAPYVDQQYSPYYMI